tara:strand:- start:499 stop:687 length:189 start_codon:yes stop_codon:yes gene_type:complete
LLSESSTLCLNDLKTAVYKILEKVNINTEEELSGILAVLQQEFNGQLCQGEISGLDNQGEPF